MWGGGVPHLFVLVLSYAGGSGGTSLPQPLEALAPSPVLQRACAGSVRCVPPAAPAPEEIVWWGPGIFSSSSVRGELPASAMPPRTPLSMLRGRSPQNGPWRAPQRTRMHEPFCRSLPLFGRKGRETVFSVMHKEGMGGRSGPCPRASAEPVGSAEEGGAVAGCSAGPCTHPVGKNHGAARPASFPPASHTGPLCPGRSASTYFLILGIWSLRFRGGTLL